MTLGAVIFDLDGTLIDSSEDLRGALNAALRDIAPEVKPLGLSAVRGMIGSGARRLVSRGLEAAGIDHDLDDALALFIEHYRSALLVHTSCYAGVKELLKALGDDGTPVAVLTNKPGDMTREILRRLQIADSFTRVIGGGDGFPRKPDPEPLVAILGELGIGPDRAVMVGDSAIDVETGRAAGVVTIGIRGGFDPEGVASAGPDALVEAFAGVGAALRRLSFGASRATGVLVSYPPDRS